jgi:hypothetical protein
VITVRELCWRARVRAGAPARGLSTVMDRLRPGTTVTEPYLCRPGGHLIARLYRPQRTAIEAQRLPPCPRRSCAGVLHATTWEREGRRVREFLRQFAETVTCRGDGLELIHAKTSGAPGQGGAATDDDLRSPTP